MKLPTCGGDNNNTVVINSNHSNSNHSNPLYLINSSHLVSSRLKLVIFCRNSFLIKMKFILV